MAARLAVIGGSSFLKSTAFSLFSPISVDTPLGRVSLYRGLSSSPFSRVVFVQRHAASPEHDYSPPHLINADAIFAALSALGCTEVVAFGSVGSLRPDAFPCGTLVLPHDYSSAAVRSAKGHSKEGHLAPGFDAALRERLGEAAGRPVVARAVYAQTDGPRFETPAEIRQLAALGGDVVGMTCAREASAAAEAGLPYALLCMVDNLGNGLQDGFSVDDFHAGVARNQRTMDEVLRRVLAAMAPPPDPAEAPRERADLVVSARWVVPMDRDADEPGRVLERHSVVVRDGRVAAVLPHERARELYDADEHADLSAAHALLPGLVNAHTHLGMSALRGFADDLELQAWLREHIWPAEARHVSGAFVRAGAELGVAEMLRGGTTSCMDQYFFPQATAEAVAAAGFRASVGAAMLDFPTSYAADFDAYLAAAERLAAEWAGHPLVRVSLSPHAPYTVCEANLARALEASARLGGLRVQMHTHEAASEVDGKEERPLAALERIGMLGSGRFSAVHMTQLTDAEVAAVARLGAAVVHCPVSNAKLASGVCRVQDLLDAGACVALGTDSTSSNNTLDMFAEMRAAALLAKVQTGRADALPAAQALRMATMGGARAMGMADEIGSLAVGKLADMCAVRLDAVEVLPVYSVVSHLVYSAGREHVTDAWVGGRRLLRGRALTTLDEERVRREAAEWGRRVMEGSKSEGGDS